MNYGEIIRAKGVEIFNPLHNYREKNYTEKILDILKNKKEII